MKLIAHRARINDDAENSVRSLDAVLAHTMGPEIDVRLTSDGVAVLMHDATTQRTGDVDRDIESLTAAELSEVRLGDGDTIPTLADYLAACRQRSAPLVMIDVKDERPEALARILTDVTDSGLTDVCFMALRTEESVVALRCLGYDGKICMLMTRADNVDRRVELAGTTRIDLLLISNLEDVDGHRDYPLAAARRAGLPTAAGVLADPDSIQQAAHDGIDFGLVDLTVAP